MNRRIITNSFKTLQIAGVLLLASACNNSNGGPTPGSAADPVFFDPSAVNSAVKDKAPEVIPEKADPVCDVGARKCDAIGSMSECNKDRSAWTSTACDPASACEDGQCRTIICQAGALSCDGNTVKTCSDRGVSFTHSSPCAANTACVGGKCAPMQCSPGAVQCIGSTVSTCKANGQGWEVTATCTATEACDPTGSDTNTPACSQMICPPNVVACKDGRVHSCDESGLHNPVSDNCEANGMACKDAKCIPAVCQAASVSCDGEVKATCKHDGLGWTKQACPQDFACAPDASEGAKCLPKLCQKGGEIFCNGNDVAQCDSTATALTVLQTCDDKHMCKQGKCVAMLIVCGDGLCDAGESVMCANDCKPITLVSPEFDKVPVGTATTLPKAPRQLSKEAAPASLGGKAIAIHGPWLLVADTDNGAVTMMDRKTMQVVSTLLVGGRPEQLVVNSAESVVFVASRDAATVTRIKITAPNPVSKAEGLKIDTMADGKPAVWKVGFEPWGLALTPDAKYLLVALTGENAIVGISAVDGVEAGRVNTASRPKTILCTPTGAVHVLHGDGQTTITTVLALTVKASPTPLAPTVALRTNNPVPACQGLVTKKIRVANRATAMCFDPEANAVLTSHVLVASGSAQDVLSAVGIKPPEKPLQFVTKCTGGYGSTCSQVPVPPPPGDPPCVGIQVRPYEPTISRVTTSLHPTVADLPIVDISSGRPFIARFDQPADIIHHPKMTMAFVAARGSNNVLVVNTAAADPMQWPIADIKVGDGPKAMAVSLDGKTLYVLNSTGFTVSEVDLAPLLAFGQGALNIDTDNSKLPTTEPLFLAYTKNSPYGADPLAPEARLGRKVFHYANNARLSASNRFACATCHLDGTEDKQVWFIAEGPRQTPALAGRLFDTAPYNWMGSKATLHDNIMGTTSRMGGSGLLQAELESLEKFLIAGLKAPPNPNVKPEGLTPQQLKGKKLFEDPVTLCSTCHAPVSLTDGLQHDVGTLTDVEIKVANATGKSPAIVYNTPSLRGLFYSAPYLHDGSALTIKDALKKTANTMGKTSQLSEAEYDDLVAYLLTL